MNAIQNPIERVIEYHEQNCNGGVNSPCNLSQDARAELAQLRATVAEQARKLDEAREIINMTAHEWTPAKKARAWLAANPAPQEEQPRQ